MITDENPYRSPCNDQQAIRVAQSIESPRFRASLDHRGLVYRRVQVSGEIDALIEYNGRGLGHESVFVNGRLALCARNRNLFRLVPHLAFEIHNDMKSMAVSIDGEGMLFVRGFRLEIDGVVVYSEGSLQVLSPF